MAGELETKELNTEETNEYDSFVEDLSADKRQPATETNEYDDYVEEVSENSRQNATVNLYNTKDINPDQSANVLNLSNETGLPADVVESDYDSILHDTKTDNNNKVVGQSPVLQKWLDNSNNAKVSSDDIDTLDKIQKQLEAFGGWLATPQGKAFEDMTLEEKRAAIGRSDPEDKLRSFVAKGVGSLGSSITGLGESLRASSNLLDEELSKVGVVGFGGGERAEEGSLGYYLTPSTWLVEAGRGASVIADFIDIPEERKTFGTEVYGAMGQMTEQILAGGKSVPTQMALLFGLGAEQQASRTDIEDDPQSSRDLKILAGGLGTAVSEKIGLDFLLRKLPDEARRTTSTFLKDKLISGGSEAVQEVVENLWHNMVASVGRSDIDIFNWEELWEASSVAFAGAASFRTLMEVALPGKLRGGNVAEAETRVENYNKLKETVLESKTFNRHKGKFEEFVNTAVEDATDPNVYFDAEQVDTFFQSREESPQEVLDQLGIDAETWGQAISSGGDIKVSLSKFLSLADTEYYDPMLQDIRTNQGDETLREAIQVNETRSKEIFTEADRILEENENAESIKASGAEVRTLVSDQLAATGKFDTQTSDYYGALHEAFAITLSSKLDVTPMEAYQKAAGLRVQAGTAEDIDAAGEVFSQEDISKYELPEDYGVNISQRMPGVTNWAFTIPIGVVDENESFSGELVKRGDGWHWLVDGKESEAGHKTRKIATYAAFVDSQQTEDVVFKQTDDKKPTIIEDILTEEGISDDDFKKYFSTTKDVRDSEREAVFTTHSGGQVEQGFSEQTTARTEEGVLLKLHHGSSRGMRLEKFSFESLGQASAHPTSGLGVFSTTEQSHAESYGDVLDTFHVDMRNPKTFTIDTLPEFDSVQHAYEFRESLRAEGKDGIILDYREEGGGLQYIMFDYEQVVSEKPTAETYKQNEQAYRNHLGLYSAVEKAVLEMNLPQWKQKPKEKFTEEENARYNELLQHPLLIGEKTGIDREEFKVLQAKYEKTIAAANGNEIWAKLKKTPGIKKEELEWLGVEDYLSSKKKFTRDEVASFVRDNGVEVSEVVAEGEGEQEDFNGFNWSVEVDTDPEMYSYRVDDIMDEFENADDDSEFHFFDFNEWANSNSDRLENKIRPELEVEQLEEIDKIKSEEDVNKFGQALVDYLDSIDINAFRKIQSVMYNDFQEAAEAAALKEYLDSPTRIYNDETTGITLRGDEERGYVFRHTIPGGGNTDWQHLEEVHSLNEAEIQLSDYARENDLFEDSEGREDVNIPKWGEYIYNDPNSSADNYRELKLNLPKIEGKGSETDFYYDVHFPDRNLVTFLRLTDRTLETSPGSGAEFNKTYFIEEFQSDWHQEGRQKGYQLTDEDAGELDARAMEIRNEFMNDIVTEAFNKYNVEDLSELGFSNVTDNRFEVIVGILENNGKIPEHKDVADGRAVPYTNMAAVISESENLDKYVSDFKEYESLQSEAEVQRYGVLDAPFKGDGWISLGLKRAIVDAVEQGYESISWVDSNVLTERWSDRYKTLYETQYDKKMPSIVKKLTKTKPQHLTFSGEPIISYDKAAEQYDIKPVGDNYSIFKDGTQRTTEYTSRESAEESLHTILTKEASEPGYWTIPITPELAERVKQDGFALYQNKESADKGQIQFPGLGKEAVVTLFESADLSTFLHESGHFFIQAYRDLAAESPEIQADLDILTEWMGVNDSSEIGIEEHEQFARGFEAYLREGKAPNVELQSVFDRFKAWLLNVYKTVSQLNVQLNDEVRSVMDRMLATEEAIKEAEEFSSLLPVYDSAEAAGMTEDEYKNYTKAYERATNAAQTDADSELLSRLKREQKDAWKQERNNIRDEVLEELYALPANQARWFFMRGTLPSGESLPGIEPVKLSRDALIEMYGDELNALWRELPFGKYSVWTKNESGVHPDEIAPMFGFANGNEMVQAMVDTKGNLNKIATEEADLMMRTKYGDPDGKKAIAELALETVQNQERSNFLSIELRALEKRAGLDSTPRNVIKRAATRIINGLRISEIKPNTYLRTASKWSRKSIEAATEQKFEEAADAKRKQLLNQAIYQEALKAQKYVDTKTRYLKKFDSPGVRKNLARDYLDQIDNVLESYDLKKTTTLKETERRQSLNEWIASQVEQGLEVIIPSDLIERARQRSYKVLPYEEFIGLVDSVKNIEHIARFKQKLLVNKEKRDFNETIESLVDIALKTNTWKSPKLGLKTDLDKAKSFSREFFASHVKMEFLLQQLDGNKPDGLWWNAVFRPIAEAEDNEITISQEYMNELNTIFEQYGEKGRTGLYKETLNTEQSLGRNIKRAELISMALNWGNDGNRKALLRGEDWTQDTIQAVLDEHMSEQDWNTVQSTWALIDTLWPEISKLQKELTGVVPEKVEATTVKTKFGTFTGGYYPLVYDIERSLKAFKYEEKMTVDEMFGGNFTQPTTRQGHTKERVGSDGMPVKLDLDVIGTHLVNVIHDLTHRKAVLQADHILQNKQVAETIIAITDRETYQHIRPWLAGIASDKRPFAGWMEQVVGRLRRGATAVNMGWKVTTAIVQPLGYFQSIELLGAKYAMKGLAAFYGSPLKAKNTIDEVFSKSVMMANRSKTFDRDVRDAVRRIKGDSLDAKIQRSLFSHIGFMDYSVSIPTWLGAYAKSMDEQQAEGKTLDEPTAIAYADSVVRMSQSAGGAKDLAAIQRGSELQRAFTMFYSYFSVLHNLIRTRMKESNKAGFTGANVTRTTMSMMYLVVLPAVLAEMIVGRMPGEDDEEDLLAWSAKISIAYPFMTMVGVRDFANALSSGYTYQATPLLDAADSFLKSGEGIGDAFTDFTGLTDEEFDRKDVKNMAMSTGYIFALPSRQLYTTGEHLYAILNDDEEFSLYELLYRNKRD